MYLWLRLLRVLVAAPLRPRIDFFQESRLTFRVLPHDLDANLHMNNARYLALMDLGRYDLVLRTGMWKPMRTYRWQPVVGETLVRYRRPLRPFQSLHLISRVRAWDERWLFIEHRIESGGQLACHAIVRAAFLEYGRTVPPSRVAGAAGFAGVPPEQPPWVRSWRETDLVFTNG